LIRTVTGSKLIPKKGAGLLGFEICNLRFILGLYYLILLYHENVKNVEELLVDLVQSNQKWYNDLELNLITVKQDDKNYSELTVIISDVVLYFTLR